MSAHVTSMLVTGSAVTTIRFTGVGEGRDGVEHASVELFCVGEEQRRIPAEQHQARDPAGGWISRDVVIAADPVHATQHGVVRPPPVPQELDDGQDDGQTDSGNHPEDGDAREAHHREPEFPSLDAEDAAQVCDLEQANRRRDHYGGQGTAGQTLQQIRARR
jgi:hypothetical protein